MISVSNDWINAHKKRLLPEGELRITIYASETFNSLNLLKVLDRQDIIDFSYKTSLSIIGKETQETEAVLKIFKASLLDYDFPKTSFAKVEIGYHINGSIEWHFYDCLQIAEQEIPINGNEATFTLKQLGYRSFENEYILGSGSNGLGVSPLTITNRIIDYEKRTYFPSMCVVSMPTFLYSCERSLGTCSVKNALLYISQALGTTFYARTFLYTSSGIEKVGLNFNFAVVDKNAIVDDYVIDNNNSYTYPEIEIDYYDFLKISVYESRTKKDSQGNIEKIGFNSTLSFSPSTPYHIIQYGNNIFNQTSISGGLLYDFEIYGNCIYVSSLNTATYSITGEISLLEVEKTISTTNLVYGGGKYILEVDNPLIGKMMRLYGNTEGYLKEWSVEGEVISCDFRIDPRLQLLDKVQIIDFAGNVKFAVVEELEWTYKGAFNGKIKARRFEPLPIPPEVNIDEYGDKFSFDVYNDNYKDVDLVIVYSGGTITKSIPANSKITINDTNTHQLNDSFRAEEQGLLEDDVYCYFLISGKHTQNASILERQV